MSPPGFPAFLLLLLLHTTHLHGLPTPALTPTPAAVTSPLTPGVVTPGRASGGLMADEGPSGVSEDTTPHEVLGACRATCVEQTLEWPPSDDTCLQDSDCLTCWQLCELLYQDEIKWRSMCGQTDCTVGCTTACKFSFNTVLTPSSMPWEFPTTPLTTEVSDTALHVSWESPRPRPRGKEATPTGRPYLVYTLLFWDDNNPRWSRVTATLDFITQVDGHHSSFPGLQFLLIASSPAGTVARAVPPYPALPAPTREPTTTTTTTTTKPKPAPVSVDVAVDVHLTPEGALETELTWAGRRDVHVTYVVTWERVTCNVDPLMAFCPLPENSMTAHIKSKGRQEIRVVLTQLTYNSRYVLTVSVDGAVDVPPTHVAFYTPTCPRIDATFMTCLPAPPPAQVRPEVKPSPAEEVRTSPVVTEPTTTKGVETTTTTTAEATTGPVKVTSTDGQRVTGPPASQSSDDSTLTWALSAEVLLLAAAVSLGSVVVVLLAYCGYSRWARRREQLELAKVMQSYTHLPLLGVNGSQSLSNSLHHLHLHNATAQALLHSPALNQYTTPTHQLAPPTHGLAPPTGPGLLQVPAHHLQALAGSQYWPSMEGLVMNATPNATSTPSGVGSLHVPATAHAYAPAPALASLAVTVEDPAMGPSQVRVVPSAPVGPSSRGAPTPVRPAKRNAVPSTGYDHPQQKARSLEELDFQAHYHSSSSTTATPSRRATSAVDLSTASSSALPVAPSQRRARRQIHFAAVDDAAPEVDSAPEPEAPKTTGSRRAAVPTPVEGLSPYHHMLHTVPEEALSDLSDDDDGGTRPVGGLEWEYEDLELTDSFRGRTGTV